MKKIIAIVLMAAVLLLLASCGEGTDRAKATVEDFLRCIKEGRYEDAALMTHPSRAATAAEIEELFVDAAQEWDVDFSGGMTLYYYSVTSAYYDSDYDGSAWELWAELEVSGRTLDLEIVVVENDAGYGIAKLRLDGDGASYLGG